MVNRYIEADVLRSILIELQLDYHAFLFPHLNREIVAVIEEYHVQGMVVRRTRHQLLFFVITEPNFDEATLDTTQNLAFAV